jgi:hypothetical protein
MEDVFSLVLNATFKIQTPFIWKTKADVIRMIHSTGAIDLIEHSMSCSRTRSRTEGANQCGYCSQCLERRFAAYSAGVEDIDGKSGYGFDLVLNKLDEPEIRGFIIDYLRAAKSFATLNLQSFETHWINELAELTPGIEGTDEFEKVERIWTLCRHHGDGVLDAVRVMQKRFGDLTRRRISGSLLDIVAHQDYLLPTPELAAHRLAVVFAETLPVAFATAKPIHENQLNDVVDSTLRAMGERFRREFPVLKFATARTIPDHSSEAVDLFIESKYLKEGTAVSAITDDLAADRLKYGRHRHILFLIYDPFRRIKDDAAFKQDFEQNQSCTVAIVR